MESALKAYDDFLRVHHLEESPLSAAIYQVHEDLLRIRKWTQLRVHTSRSGRPYLSGTAPALFDAVFPQRRLRLVKDGSGGVFNGSVENDDGDVTQVVVPLPVTEQLSPRALKLFCEECVGPGETGRRRCVTVAIVDDETTTAYYRVLDSMPEILHPQWKMKPKRKREDVMRGTMERPDGAGAEIADGSAGTDEEEDDEDDQSASESG